MNGHLAIIPCTKSKIWDVIPQIGEVPADCAYIGPEFVLSKYFLASLTDRMIIFSAKYGFLDPWDTIPDSYDITFSRNDDLYVDEECLKEQAKSKGLLNFKYITTTCNWHYQKRIIDTFSPSGSVIISPVKDLLDEKEICLKISELILRKSENIYYEIIN